MEPHDNDIERRATAIRQAVLAGFPKRHMEAIRLDRFDLNREQRAACERISPAINAGNLSLITGGTGAGKTMLACSYGYGWYYRGFSRRCGKARYWTHTHLVTAQKNWYAARSTADSPMDQAGAAGMLMLDENVVTHGSEHDQSTIRDLINRRYDARKLTVLLTNLDDAGILSALDAPMLDRVADGGAMVRLTGQSLRGMA